MDSPIYNVEDQAGNVLMVVDADDYNAILKQNEELKKMILDMIPSGVVEVEREIEINNKQSEIENELNPKEGK
jgi:hypothetical protein